MFRRASEVIGGGGFEFGGCFQPFRAVVGGDVAEAALVLARYPGGWLVCGEPADQGSEVLYELSVEAVLGTCTVRCCE